MEVALGIVAVLALALVAFSAPAVITQHRIDKAFKRFGLAITSFSYQLGQVKFAMEGTAEALQGFVDTWNRAGYTIGDSDTGREVR